MEWSYELLTGPERVVFERVSVFAGGWTLDAAEYVCADPDANTADILLRLVEKSLVVAAASADGLSTRYRLLETLRQFAHERRLARGQVDAARERHAAYYLQLAEQLESDTLGPAMFRVMERLEREHDNCRAALSWFLEQGDAERGLRLVAGLPAFGGLA